MDLTQLRTFLAVSEQLSFSAAARRLGLSQSAVSQHVRRLEATIGAQLLVRDTHRVSLTAEGEALTSVARSMLDLNDDVFRTVSDGRPRGRVRFGVSEDFALSRLPDLLRRFRSGHPAVDLELTVGLSVLLHRRLVARELDVVLAKRPSPTARAELVFTDRLAWVGAPELTLARDQPVPLIVYPPPSLTRDRAIEALQQADRGYLTACTSSSLSGLRAAALGGLGVMPFSQSLTPIGLVEVGDDLPALGETEFVLSTGRRRVSSATQALIDAVQADHHALHGEPAAESRPHRRDLLSP